MEDTEHKQEEWITRKSVLGEAEDIQNLGGVQWQPMDHENMQPSVQWQSMDPWRITREIRGQWICDSPAVLWSCRENQSTERRCEVFALWRSLERATWPLTILTDNVGVLQAFVDEAMAIQHAALYNTATQSSCEHQAPRPQGGGTTQKENPPPVTARVAHASLAWIFG